MRCINLRWHCQWHWQLQWRQVHFSHSGYDVTCLWRAAGQAARTSQRLPAKQAPAACVTSTCWS